MFSQRPNKEEAEDEILRQQEKFLRQKGLEPDSKFSGTKSQQPAAVNAETSKDENTVDIVNLNVKIVERNFSDNPEYSMLYVNRDVIPSNEGFPIPTTLPAKGTNVKRGSSLYAQMYLKKNGSIQNNSDGNLSPDDSGIVSGIGLGSANWKRDISEIKNENKKLIENMSSEEIEKMRSELLQKLNPKTVEFLQSKKFKYRSDVIKENEQEETKFQSNEIESSGEMSDISDKLAIPIEEVQSNKYINMNIIEKDKLTWMGNITKPSSRQFNVKDGNNLSARFNLNGDLIDSANSDEVDVHEGLHHHGEEPERPGYTINELLMYLQSSFSSQKQIGLRVFEQIITKAYQGMFDACFNTNLIEYLLKDTSLVLVVRTCLDDASETVWKSSISALTAILCNTLYDELFLDRGFLIFENYLGDGYKIDLHLKPELDEEAEIDDQVPDQQYLMYDLVECIINRTSILKRFAYLLKNQLSTNNDHDEVFIEKILDILIRMARHSKEATEAVLLCPDLMEILILHLISPKNTLESCCKMVHCKTFKLIRVCVSSIQSSSNSKTLPNSINRLFNLLNYVSFINSLNFCLNLNSEDVPQNAARILLKISIESLRTWLKLLSLNYSQWKHPFLTSLLKNFSPMFPCFIKILNFCKSLIPLDCQSAGSIKTTFDFQFASCIFMLLKLYHELLPFEQNNFAQVYFLDLFEIVMRWFTIINNESIVPNFDTCLCILILTDFLLKHLRVDDSFYKSSFVKLFNENHRFADRLFTLSQMNSNILLLKERASDTYHDSANHPSFGSRVPLFNDNSPICLLQCLIKVALNSSNPFRHSTSRDGMFRRLSEYISLVSSNISKDFKPSIFDMIEINFISQACILVQDGIEHREGQMPDKVGKSALEFSLLVHLQNLSQLKYQIIANILFNKKLFASNLYSEKDFELFRSVYQKYSNFDDDHWLFHPLLRHIQRLHEKNEDAQKVSLTLEELLSCLKYIHLICTTLPQHFDHIGIGKEAFFVFIASVFLVDDHHFFNRDVKILLEQFLVQLLDSPGLVVPSNSTSILCYGNVSDFFSKFVTQFENCSYSDPLFCNYLLVFFQQQSSAYFRNYFYSEHSSLIRMIRLQINQLLISMENFLFPLETNLETLEIYLKTLLCELLNPEQSPVLYCQMIHHLNHALFRENSPIKKRLLTDECQTQKDKKDRLTFEKLIRSVQMSDKCQLKSHLFNYSHFDSDCKYGLVIRNE